MVELSGRIGNEASPVSDANMLHSSGKEWWVEARGFARICGAAPRCRLRLIQVAQIKWSACLELSASKAMKNRANRSASAVRMQLFSVARPIRDRANGRNRREQKEFSREFCSRRALRRLYFYLPEMITSHMPFGVHFVYESRSHSVIFVSSRSAVRLPEPNNVDARKIEIPENSSRALEAAALPRARSFQFRRKVLQLAFIARMKRSNYEKARHYQLNGSTV